MGAIPHSVVNAVYRRAGDDGTLTGGVWCEACGGPIPTGDGALHHRLPRSAGGLHIAENLMLVHGGVRGGCHNLGEYSIHQNPDRSYRLGHLVPRGVDPATVPVVTTREVLHLRA